MLKLFGLLFAIIAATQAVSDWTEQTAITDDIMDLAKWSASQLTPYTNGEDHIVMAVKNLQTQVADGMNYKFTLEVVVSTADNRYFMKSCDISLYEQELTQTKYFLADPVCNDLQQN